MAATLVITVAAIYGQAYELTNQVVGKHGEIADDSQLGKCSVTWFLKTMFLRRLGGISFLSLFLIPIYWLSLRIL